MRIEISTACVTILAWALARPAPATAATGTQTADEQNPTRVTADFSVHADYPLSKHKFGGFNSGMVKVAHYRRDIALFDEVRLPSLRIDLAWGARWSGWARPQVTGTATELRYDFAEMDEIASLLNAHGVLPYWSYCYVPDPLQARPGDYRTPPDPVRWGRVLEAMARHYRENRPSNPVGYHEVYNEPDNRDFFRGGLDDYLAMYREGVRGLRAGDPDAVVGGPSVAFTDAWIPPFLEFVARERLPLDFFSFHFYPGVPYKSQDIARVIADMRRELAQRPEFATTEMHLNEYNAYRIDYPKGGRQDRYPLAAALLHDYRFFLSQPDLTHVNWAQFMDSGGGNYSGMISIEGRRKAVFNAAAIYARMPVDRRLAAVEGFEGIESLASADAHTCACVIWNRSDRDRRVNVSLRGLSFPRGRLRVYRIDGEHASWGDREQAEQLEPVETRPDLPAGPLDWSGPLVAGGVVYLECDDGTGLTEWKPNPVARIIRVLRHHPDRSTRSYADFDRQTFTARLGMAGESRALEQIGVVVESLPKQLVASVEVDGPLRRLDRNSLLGVRIDYQVGAESVRGVLFHGPCGEGADLYDAQRDAVLPWGTGRQADRAIAVADMARFVLRPAEHAPEGWTGRAQLTFILQNSGPGTRARMRLAAE